MKKYIDDVIKYVLFGYMLLLPWLFLNKILYYSRDELLLFTSGSVGVTDFFLYIKAVVTLLAAFVLLALLVIKGIICRQSVFDTKLLRDRILITCLCIYEICTFISFLLSKYRNIALTGGVNSLEGTFVLMSYGVLFIASKQVFSNVKNNKLIKKWVLIQSSVLLIMTLIEICIAPINELIAGRALESDFDNMISLTFYNSSYLAAFTLLLQPFCVHYFMKSRTYIEGIIWSVLSYTTLVSNFMTRSTAGFYLIIAETVAVIIWITVADIKNKENAEGKGNAIGKKNPVGKVWILKIFCIAVLIVISFGLNKVIDNRMTKAVKGSAVNSLSGIHKADYYKVTDIKVEGDSVSIISDDSALVCNIDEEGNLYFTDHKGERLSVNVSDDVIYFDGIYDCITANVENSALCLDLGYKGKIRFRIYNNNFYPMLTDGTIVRDISGTGVDCHGLDTIISGRGYIWFNTLPIIKNTVIFGHGAGTYEMYFKQFDYVGLLNAEGNVDLIIDKPHCWYLQMSCAQGVIAALSVVIIIITSLVSVIKGKGNLPLRVALIVVVAVFAVFEMINDSSVTVNPLYWIILGLACTSVYQGGKSTL